MMVDHIGEFEQLYRYYLDCGRMGEIEGVFVASSQHVKKLIGSTIRFGDILGKHSDTCPGLSPDDLEVLSVDDSFILQFKRIFPVGVGYNPLEFIEEFE